MAELGYTTKPDRTPEHWDTPQLALELLGLEQLIHQWSMTPRLSSDAEQLLLELKRVFPRAFRTASENKLRANVFWNSDGWESCKDAFAEMLRDGLNQGEEWTTCLDKFRRDLEYRFHLNVNDKSMAVGESIEEDNVLSRSSRTKAIKEHKPLTTVNLQDKIAVLTSHGDCNALTERQQLQFKMGLRDSRVRLARARRISETQLDSNCAVSTRDHCGHRTTAGRAYRLATLVLPERLFRTIGL